MKKFTFTLLTIATCAALCDRSHAQLPAAPLGFDWELQSAATYADSDTFSSTLDGTQSLAPAAGPAVSSLAETLALTSFDAPGTEASLEASNPGMDFAVVVLSSTYTATLEAAASSQIFNFDTTFSPRVYSGTTTVSNFQISGAGTAGPASDALVNAAFNVGAFSIGNFEDATSSATAATVNLSDSGVAATDGSPLNFNFGGSAITFLNSDDPAAINQSAVMSASAFGSAGVTTSYEVYKLVEIPVVPEPGSAALAIIGSVLLLRRRR